MPNKIYKTQKYGGCVYARVPVSWKNSQFIVVEESPNRVVLNRVVVGVVSDDE